MSATTSTLTMVLSLAVIIAALWHFSVEDGPQTSQIDSAGQNLPQQLSDLWDVLSPGFR